MGGTVIMTLIRVLPQRLFTVALAIVLLVLVSGTCLATDFGSLSGVVRDQLGNPLPGLLLSLMRPVESDEIPLMAKTDGFGQVFIYNILAGSYHLVVKSSGYQGPQNRVIDILPGETAAVSLVVEQLLGLGYETGSSVGVKSLLRATNPRRLILRAVGKGIQPEKSRPAGFFDEAVFEVFTSGGGSDRGAFPRDSNQGTTTNFAARDELPDGTEYIIAGQFNSGNDSLFRIKNWLKRDLGKNHKLDLLMGYGRIGFDEPSLALLDNPAFVSQETAYVSAPGNMKVLTLGFQDKWTFGDTLSVIWGMEFNQVRRRDAQYFTAPNASLTYKPTGTTSVEVSLSSKRRTLSNSIGLGNGETVELNNSLNFARVNGRNLVGTSRHYEVKIAQQLGQKTALEVAGFDSRLMGAVPPLLARGEMVSPDTYVELSDHESRSKGYRLTINHQLSQNIRTAVSYIRGSAFGFGPDRVEHLLMEPSTLRSLLLRHGYQAISAEMEGYIPQSQTHFTAVVRAVPVGNPVTTIDPLSDVYETPNRSVNLFLRQLVPVPLTVVRFLGLDFLSEYRFEALLGIRNLANDGVGGMQGTEGDIILVQQPRSVRGGIALNF